MITSANVDNSPPRIRQDMQELSRAWPVGARVKHLKHGWVGKIAVDTPNNPHSLIDGIGAHCILVPGDRSNTAVCVTHEIDGHEITAWYRPEVLTLEGESRTRTRTRVIRHVGRAA